jgi:hypothetical protein
MWTGYSISFGMLLNHYSEFLILREHVSHFTCKQTSMRVFCMILFSIIQYHSFCANFILLQL